MGILRIIQSSLQKCLDQSGVPGQKETIKGKIYDMGIQEPDEMSRRNWQYDGFAEYQTNGEGGRSYRSISAHIRTYDTGEDVTHVFSPTVSRGELEQARMVGGWRYRIQSHYFTELSAPFLIALCAPLAWAYSKWWPAIGEALFC